MDMLCNEYSLSIGNKIVSMQEIFGGVCDTGMSKLLNGNNSTNFTIVPLPRYETFSRPIKEEIGWVLQK